MPTAAELLFAEQFKDLREIAANKGWDLEQTDGPGFVLSLPARDGSRLAHKVNRDGYKGNPWAWHWYNREPGALDPPADTRKGSGYFHSSGPICAPWNRLAYKSINAKGPHDDWNLANWMTNPKTGQ